MRTKQILFGSFFFVLVLILAFYAIINSSFWRSRAITISVPISSYDLPKNFEPFVQIVVMQPATSTTIIPKPNSSPKNILVSNDIEPQPRLSNPPEEIKAIYATSWSAGSPKKIQYLIDLINETELNAIVIDIKDYSGFVAYNSDLKTVHEYNAEEIRIPRLNTLLKTLHDHNIYAIARLSTFQDQRLPKARPDLAITSSSTQSVWKDQKGLSWIDPASEEAWAYNVSIAREATARGFDEINFDYIRFISDGDLEDAVYPFWDKKTPRRNVIKSFFSYVRKELPEIKISADLFGLVTANYDDLGIGQHLEDAFPYFDAIAPMVYPSHYRTGSFGITEPAKHPYEIIKKSMDIATMRWNKYNAGLMAAQASNTPQTIEKIAKFRPWLQDFDLGADYTAEMVRAQIQALYDAASSSPESLGGWMLWNPSNVYTKEALHTNF